MPDAEARFQCRHILADGRRCRSACLRHEDFCYYHHASRKPVANPAERKGRRTVFTLPRIEDRASILLAVNEILTRIAANEIDARRAGRLLYAIQIAACSMPRLAALRPSDDEDAPALVEEVVLHPTLGEIAPRSELTRPEERNPPRKSLAQSLREEMEELEARNIAEFGASADDSSADASADSSANSYADAASADEPLSAPAGRSDGSPGFTTIEAELRQTREKLREAREELESRQSRIDGMHTDLARYRDELAKTKAQAAEARQETLRAEQGMVWHMDRHAEARAELESLKPAAEAQPAILPATALQPVSDLQPVILTRLQASASSQTDLRPSLKGLCPPLTRVILSGAQRSGKTCFSSFRPNHRQ